VQKTAGFRVTSHKMYNMQHYVQGFDEGILRFRVHVFAC